MKKILGLLAILVLAICLTGCTTSTSSNQKTNIPVVTPTPEVRYVYVTVTVTAAPTPISTPWAAPNVPILATPKYNVGDISGRARGDSTGWLILDYTPESDRYTTQQVHFESGQWVYYTWSPNSYGREFEEEYDPILLGHINPQSVKSAF